VNPQSFPAEFEFSKPEVHDFASGEGNVDEPFDFASGGCNGGITHVMGDSLQAGEKDLAPESTEFPVASDERTTVDELLQNSTVAPTVDDEAVYGAETVDFSTKLTDPPNHARDLLRALKGLGKRETLTDKKSVPRLAHSVKESFFDELGADAVFKAFAQMFTTAKGVGHRKAILYVVHDLLTRKGGEAMALDGRRPSCFRGFLVKIGPRLRSFPADERQQYCKLLDAWKKTQIFPPSEMSELKDAWDMDTLLSYLYL